MDRLWLPVPLVCTTAGGSSQGLYPGISTTCGEQRSSPPPVLSWGQPHSPDGACLEASASDRAGRLCPVASHDHLAETICFHRRGDSSLSRSSWIRNRL